MLLFCTARTLARMLTSTGRERFDLVEEYPFWTEEEKEQIRRERLIQQNDLLFQQLLAASDHADTQETA